MKGAASAVCLLDSFVARGRFVGVHFQKQDPSAPFSVPCKCPQSVPTLKNVRRTFVRSFKKYLPYNEKTQQNSRNPLLVNPFFCFCTLLHRKKKFKSFPSLAGMSLTKLPLGRNNSVMTSLFPPMECLVVTSRLGTGNLRTFFYGVSKNKVSHQRGSISIQFFVLRTS